MSHWDERIKSHAIWKQMRALGEMIDQTAAIEQTDPAVVIDVERIRIALTFIGQRLAGCDPQVQSPAPFDNMAGHVQSTIASLKSFINDGNAVHIAEANTQIDEALWQLGDVLVPVSVD